MASGRCAIRRTLRRLCRGNGQCSAEIIELGHIHGCDLGLFRMSHAELGVGGFDDRHAEVGDPAPILRRQGKAQLRGIYHGKKTTGIDQIDHQPPKAGDFENLVQAVDKAGHKPDGYRLNFAVFDPGKRAWLGPDGVSIARMVSGSTGFEQTSLDQRRYRADGAMTAHIRVAVGVHIDQPNLSPWRDRLGDHHANRLAAAARFAGEQQTGNDPNCACRCSRLSLTVLPGMGGIPPTTRRVASPAVCESIVTKRFGNWSRKASSWM